MKLDVQRLHWYAPRVGAAALFSTLAICFTVTKLRGTYVGGLTWPFFSDMGREAPTYYVFIVGLSVVAGALSVLWQVNAAFQRRVFTDATPRAYRWVMRTATLLGAISPIGLPILAIFDTSNHSMTHSVTTAMFFFLQTLAVIFNTVVTYHIYAAAKRVYSSVSSPVNEKLDGLKKYFAGVRRTFLLQASAAGLFSVVFIIYVPVGMAIVDKYTRLTIQECLDRDLGQHYCTHTVKLDDRDTKLWNYELDFGMNQFRALMQIMCILTLLAYTGSFISHDFDSIPSPEESIQYVSLSPVGAVEDSGSPQLHEYAQVHDLKTPTPRGAAPCLA